MSVPVLNPCWTDAVKAVTRTFAQVVGIVTVCQLRTFVVHLDEYTALLAFTIK